MNFKTFGFTAAVATAVVASSVMVSAPAQAIDLMGRKLNFGGSVQFNDSNIGSNTGVGNNFTLDFLGTGGRIGAGTSSEFGVFDQALNVANLTLKKTSATTWELAAPQPSWITNLGNPPGGISFNLSTFVLTAVGGNKFDADFSGIFNPQGVEALGGILTSQGSTFNTDGSTYSASITAIPTPALLPGLAALGLSAIRKRKQVEEPEAVKA